MEGSLQTDQVKLYSKTLKLDKCNVEALNFFGNLAFKQKKYQVSVEFFTRSINSNPNCKAPYQGRANAFQAINKFENAISDLSQAIKIDPKNSLLYQKRALIFCRTLEFSKAIVDFSSSIELLPKAPDAYYNRAVAYRKLGDLEAALSDFSEAISINPQHYQAFNNRGMIYRELRQFHKAIQDFGSSITIDPKFFDGHWNKALTHLMIEDYENAWPLYEYRWDSSNFTSHNRNFEQPLWLGKTSLSGKKILLHSEQGLGDSIQFSRYVSKFKNLNCTVLLEVEKPLMRIMETLLPKKQIFEKNSTLPEFDYHCPLMSLPLAFKTTKNNIPRSIPYLSADTSQIKWWKNYLNPTKKPRIGFIWRGNPAHKNDQNRSIELSTIINALSRDFEWYSLQIDVSNEDKKIICKTPHLTHLGETVGDFAKTAALCENLDAIISVDTSIAHLAAAIGRPVHLLLAYNADSRWHIDRTDTLWYPTMVLHRQKDRSNWVAPLQLAIKRIKKIY